MLNYRLSYHYLEYKKTIVYQIMAKLRNCNFICTYENISRIAYCTHSHVTHGSFAGKQMNNAYIVTNHSLDLKVVAYATICERGQSSVQSDLSVRCLNDYRYAPWLSYYIWNHWWDGTCIFSSCCGCHVAVPSAHPRHTMIDIHFPWNDVSKNCPPVPTGLKHVTYASSFRRSVVCPSFAELFYINVWMR